VSVIFDSPDDRSVDLTPLLTKSYTRIAEVASFVSLISFKYISKNIFGKLFNYHSMLLIDRCIHIIL
jgi:hypothetical protein